MIKKIKCDTAEKFIRIFNEAIKNGSIGRKIVITKDLDFSEVFGFRPINLLEVIGKVEIIGNHHDFSNITFLDANKDNVGLFSVIPQKLEFSIAGVHFHNPALIGNDNVGALAGTADNVKIYDCIVSGSKSQIEGQDNVGAFIGASHGLASIHYVTTSVNLEGWNGYTTGALIGRASDLLYNQCDVQLPVNTVVLHGDEADDMYGNAVNPVIDFKSTSKEMIKHPGREVSARKNIPSITASFKLKRTDL